MLRVILYLIKASIFSLAVLVAGNIIEIQGITLSDHVRFLMGKVEKSGIGKDAMTLLSQKASVEDHVLEIEKKKLKKLIEELNHSYAHPNKKGD